MKLTFLCCHHAEETPSLTVDLVKGKFYCFSCGKEGDHLDDQKVLEMVINRLETMLDYLKGYRI